jgi:hypothetical protein
MPEPFDDYLSGLQTAADFYSTDIATAKIEDENGPIMADRVLAYVCKAFKLAGHP